MSQVFITYQDQIKHLKINKSLIIVDEMYADQILRQIGYFSLIYRYKEPFKNKTIQKYESGTTLEHIVQLYEFDENLRSLFMKYLLKIEKMMKSLISYRFTELYGENQQKYLDPSNYNLIASNQKEINKLTTILKDLIKIPSKYDYIQYQHTKYGNIPLWAVMNSLTFGQVSKFYSLSKNNIQSHVCKEFDGIKENDMDRILDILSLFRNVCAHNDRLFNLKSRGDIPDLPIHKKIQIPKKGQQYKTGKKDLFAVVICFKYLLSHNDFQFFIKELRKLVKKYLEAGSSLTEIKICTEMGFPQNWTRITSYKK